MRKTFDIDRAELLSPPEAPRIALATAGAGRVQVCTTAARRVDDAYLQTRDTLSSLEAMLGHLGSDKHQLFRATFWIKRPNDVIDVSRAWNEWVSDDALPVVVHRQAHMAAEDILVEIRLEGYRTAS